jgi:alpha-tubulin suppressor-like RCC1 family protein
MRVPFDFPQPIRQVAVGTRNTCVLLKGGTVWCWGEQRAGQLGPERELPFAPAVVPGLKGVVQIGVGDEYACARVAAGKVLCWGLNSTGQLGAPQSGECVAAPVRGPSPATVACNRTPSEVAGISAAADLQVGPSHACVVTQGQELWCWGGAAHDKLGQKPTETCTRPTPMTVAMALRPLPRPNISFACATRPVRVGALTKGTKVRLSRGATCTLTAAGDLGCWGNLQLRGIRPRGLRDLGRGGDFTCVLLKSGLVGCGGNNATEQLGTCFIGSVKDPVRVILQHNQLACQLSPVWLYAHPDDAPFAGRGVRSQ